MATGTEVIGLDVIRRFSRVRNEVELTRDEKLDTRIRFRWPRRGWLFRCVAPTRSPDNGTSPPKVSWNAVIPVSLILRWLGLRMKKILAEIPVKARSLTEGITETPILADLGPAGQGESPIEVDFRETPRSAHSCLPRARETSFSECKFGNFKNMCCASQPSASKTSSFFVL
jgi:hypothetical protein